jgi:hypothetical protein
VGFVGDGADQIGRPDLVTPADAEKEPRYLLAAAIAFLTQRLGPSRARARQGPPQARGTLLTCLTRRW